MNISLDPALLEAIQALAAKLGTTVEYLFGVMTRQAVTNATIGLIWSGVYLVLCPILILSGFKANKHDPCWNTPLVPVFFLTSLLALGLLLATLSDSIKGLMNPDYYALKLLFQTLK
jgi:formate-dependent nitrite reductase membrane component NrfD